jgi:hypothetical protein
VLKAITETVRERDIYNGANRETVRPIFAQPGNERRLSGWMLRGQNSWREPIET